MLIGRWCDETTRDVQYAARALRKSRGFWAVAVLSLAIGVGANAAIFSVVKAVVLEPLPYDHADQLAVLSATDRVGGSMALSYPDLLDWKNRTQVFANLAGYQDLGFTLTSQDRSAERFPGRTVSADFFRTLGIVPSMGRDFVSADDRAGATPVAIISHRVWQGSFDADPRIVGQSVMLNARSFTVIGVLPATFEFYASGEIFAPLGLGLRASARGQRRGIYALGRLRPGMTVSQAQIEAHTIASGLAREYPSTNGDVGALVVPLATKVAGNTGRIVLTLFAAVTFVLLIACANVANLLMARGAARHTEIAVRRALGASNVRLVRQLLTESLFLAVLGGALGAGLAGWTIRGMNVLLPDDIRRLKHVEFDGWVLGFTVLLCVISSLLFGLAPAWQIVWRRPPGDVSDRLNEGARGATSDMPRRSLRHLLVMSEVSSSVVLLTAAGLMIRTLIALDGVDPGFRGANVLHAQIVLPPAQYRDDQQVAFFSRLLNRTIALPGVNAAALVMCAPLSGPCWASPLDIEGQLPLSAGGPEINFNAITTGYFRTLLVPLLQGRDFDQADRRDVPAVAIVNRSFVRRYFLDQDPIGKRIREQSERGSQPWTTIVGVVGDVRRRALDAPTAPEVFRPLAQSPINFMTLMVRVADDGFAVPAAIRQELRALDPGVPLAGFSTMEDARAQGLTTRRLPAVLLESFAGLALLLAVVGIYGVMAYSVSQRTGEIGVRLALGAQPSNVLWLIVRQGMIPVCAGIGLGLVGALGVGRTLTSLLYGVGETDVLTFALVALLLLGVSLSACIIPALRAAAIDPATAICGRFQP
jgi:putative ABC transport system permease protein